MNVPHNFSFTITYLNDELINISENFFDFFVNFKDFKNFIAFHKDFSEIFVDAVNSRKYNLVSNNNRSWYKTILNSPLNGTARVIIRYGDKLYHFSATVIQCYDKNTEFTIFFKSIDKQIQKEKRLVQKYWLSKKNSANLNNLLIHRDKLSLIGESAENIIHQWKQPLSSISLLAGNIQFHHELETLNDELLLSSIEQISNNVNYMSQTILDFKDYLKPNQPQNIFKISEAIQQAKTITSSNLKKNSTELIIEVTEERHMIGYKNEFIQAVINIINNAVDAIAIQVPDERKIFINLETKDDWNILTIEDTGGGIPQQHINKIFEHYFTSKEENGTGIGLFVTQQIIQEHHKGKISVENTNRGAKFMIQTLHYDFDKISEMESTL